MPIQGNLPFGGGGSTLFQGGVGNLGASYGNAYKSALDMNKANYGNVLKGYQDTAAAQDSAQNQIAQGYAGLDNRVMSGIDTIGGARRQEIADQYQAAQGAATQSLTNRGLGNSTVVDSVNRGLQYDRQKSETQLSDDLAGMRAGYQSNIGLANLGYLNQANQQRTDLGQNQLGWMNSVNAPYPDAGMYSQLAQQYGATAGGGTMGAAAGGLQGGAGPVTTGGHQFAPNSSIDWNAGSAPPVGGTGFQAPPGVQLDAHPTSGGYVQPPVGGFAGAALGGAASQYGQQAKQNPLGAVAGGMAGAYGQPADPGYAGYSEEDYANLT